MSRGGWDDDQNGHDESSDGPGDYTPGDAGDHGGDGNGNGAAASGVGDDGGSASGTAGADPFAELALDDDFVRAAALSEPSAAERERARRQADLARRLADEELQSQNAAHQFQRYAPTDASLSSSSRRSSRRRSSSRRHHGKSSRGKISATLRSPLLLIGLVVVIGILAIDYFTPNDGADLALAPPASSPRPKNWPPVFEDPSPTPLGVPGSVPASGGSHKFLRLQDNGRDPVAYDPCRQIHYVTRPGGPPQAQQLIREAIAELSKATGLQFIDDGPTDEAPSDDRPPYQPDRYGERWAPVLIVWSDPVESPELGKVDPASPLSSAAGFAGSRAVGPVETMGESSTLVYVTGSVVLDGPDIEQMITESSGLDRARTVIIHELGHLAGLDHVDDPTQIMFPTVSEAVTYQAGDLEGLAELGSGSCMPEI